MPMLSRNCMASSMKNVEKNMSDVVGYIIFLSVFLFFFLRQLK